MKRLTAALALGAMLLVAAPAAAADNYAQTWIGCIPADPSVQIVASVTGTFEALVFTVTDNAGAAVFQDTASGTFPQSAPFVVVNIYPAVEGVIYTSTISQGGAVLDSFPAYGDCAAPLPPVEIDLTDDTPDVVESVPVAQTAPVHKANIASSRIVYKSVWDWDWSGGKRIVL